MSRNPVRFEGYVFQLCEREIDFLQSQFATTNISSKSRSFPYAYTEHGVLMAASVLNSDTAIKVSRQIIDVFIKIREMLSAHKDLQEKIEQIERKYDQQFQVVFKAIKHILLPPEKSKPIGFLKNNKTNSKIGGSNEKKH